MPQNYFQNIKICLRRMLPITDSALGSVYSFTVFIYFCKIAKSIRFKVPNQWNINCHFYVYLKSFFILEGNIIVFYVWKKCIAESPFVFIKIYFFFFSYPLIHLPLLGSSSQQFSTPVRGFVAPDIVLETTENYKFSGPRWVWYFHVL